MQYDDSTLYPTSASGTTGTSNNSAFETWLPARLGQTLVLSQGPAFSGGGDAKNLLAVTRLYIVRVDPVTQS